MNLQEAAWKKTPEVDYTEVPKDYSLATVVDGPDRNRGPRARLSWTAIIAGVAIAAVWFGLVMYFVGCNQ